jgi:hypothetical protein
MELYKRDALTEKAMAALVKFWKLAVITLDEDARLNGIARSRCFASPEERWDAAGIEFPAARACAACWLLSAYGAPNTAICSSMAAKEAVSRSAPCFASSV